MYWVIPTICMSRVRSQGGRDVKARMKFSLATLTITYNPEHHILAVVLALLV